MWLPWDPQEDLSLRLKETLVGPLLASWPVPWSIEEKCEADFWFQNLHFRPLTLWQTSGARASEWSWRCFLGSASSQEAPSYRCEVWRLFLFWYSLSVVIPLITAYFTVWTTLYNWSSLHSSQQIVLIMRHPQNLAEQQPSWRLPCQPTTSSPPAQ